MEYFFALAGVAWIFCGALALGLSLSGTHQIIACLAISFGVLFLGLAVLLRRLKALNATWRFSQVASAPPPIPMEPEPSIEDEIDGVRAAVRLAESQAWVQSFQRWFDASRSPMAAEAVHAGPPQQQTLYPVPAQYLSRLLPPPSSAPAEYLEGEYVEHQRIDPRKISG